MKLKAGFKQALIEVFEIQEGTFMKEHSLPTTWKQFLKDWIEFDGNEASEMLSIAKAMKLKRGYRTTKRGKEYRANLIKTITQDWVESDPLTACKTILPEQKYFNLFDRVPTSYPFREICLQLDNIRAMFDWAEREVKIMNGRFQQRCLVDKEFIEEGCSAETWKSVNSVRWNF